MHDTLAELLPRCAPALALAAGEPVPLGPWLLEKAPKMTSARSAMVASTVRACGPGTAIVGHSAFTHPAIASSPGLGGQGRGRRTVLTRSSKQTWKHRRYARLSNLVRGVVLLD
jgi:hypothetical protein